MNMAINESVLQCLERWRNIPVNEIDPDTVTDLSEIEIDTTKSPADRVMSLIEQIGNPYVYKDCGMVVKISFADNGKTLQSCMEDYLKADFLIGR